MEPNVFLFHVARTHIRGRSLTHLWAGRLTTARDTDTENTEEDNKRRSVCV